MNKVDSKPPEAVLCPACGLCCNGVLFGDVELQRGDDAKRLAALGMDLFAKGRKQCFAQPCACFDGKWCQIYEDRPARCRSFECRLLQRVVDGKVTTASALKTIKVARVRVEMVRRLVHEMGHVDERIPLNQRYAAVMSGAIDLKKGEAEPGKRAKLMRAVGALTEILERDFLT